MIEEETPKININGKRNLLLLGCGALIVTFLTTTISLWMYRSSGDIYLDRSRPGYLPDKDEATSGSDVQTTFSFSETGALSASELEEYLRELKNIDDYIRAINDPYSAAPLSDQSLGITPSDVPAEESQDKD